MESPIFTPLPVAADPVMPSKPRPRPKSETPGRRHSTRRESDRFFRRLVGGMRNGVLAITRNGNVAEINAEAARIFLREACFLFVVVGLTLYLSVASVCDRVASVVRR